MRAREGDLGKGHTVGNALGDVAKGLDGLAKTLDPHALGKLGEGLGATASYLDEKVVPTASAAADQLEEASSGLRADAKQLGATPSSLPQADRRRRSSSGLRADAKQLGALLRETPPDLKAARD